MGNQCCVEGDSGAQPITEIEGVPDDKPATVSNAKSRKLADKPAVIEQQIPAPAPPVVEAEAKIEPEARTEPDPEPPKIEETQTMCVPMVFHVPGSDVELFTVNQELSKKVNGLRVRSGPSANDSISYRVPTSANVKLHVDVSDSQRDWWRIHSATDKSGMCIGLAGWAIKNIDGSDTLSALSAPGKFEEHTVYIRRKPLGLVFNKECPIKVKNFKNGSHGQEVGIRKGWILKSINGEEFTNFTEFEDAMDLLKRLIEPLPN